MSPLLGEGYQFQNISPLEMEKLEKMMDAPLSIVEIPEIPNDLIKEIENVPNSAKFTDIQLIEELESFALTLM